MASSINNTVIGLLRPKTPGFGSIQTAGKYTPPLPALPSAPQQQNSSYAPSQLSTSQNSIVNQSTTPIKGLVNPATPPTPTYSGLVGSLATQQNSPNNQLATQSATSLQGLGATNQGNSGPAYDAYQAAIKSEQDLKSGIAKSYGNIESQAIPLEFQQGREQVLARQNASLIDAAQNATSEKAAALGYSIQGNQAQQGAYNLAGGIANTAQGQQQSALNQAAGYAAPQVTGYGQTAFNPLENNFGASGGGNLDPQTQASQLAQNVISGKMTYDQALSAMSYAGNAGNTFLNNAITSAGGNPLQLQASGTANQGVIQTQAQTIAGYQSAFQQGKNLQAQLSDLISTFGLNPADLNVANATIQKIAQNTSSPQYQMLHNYINEVANTYSQILTPPGGAPTDTSRSIATSMLDATAKGTSLQAVMQGLDQQAQAKIAGVSTTSAGQSNFQNGQTSSSGGYNFVFTNGKWVPA